MRAGNRVRENGAQLTQVFGIRDPFLIDLLDHGGEDAGVRNFLLTPTSPRAQVMAALGSRRLVNFSESSNTATSLPSSGPGSERGRRGS
jgi:hypothetical protein